MPINDKSQLTKIFKNYSKTEKRSKMKKKKFNVQNFQKWQ